MGAYVGWTVAAILVVVGFAMLVVIPGVGVVASVALAVGIVMAALLGISYGAARGADVTPRRVVEPRVGEGTRRRGRPRAR